MISNRKNILITVSPLRRSLIHPWRSLAPFVLYTFVHYSCRNTRISRLNSCTKIIPHFSSRLSPFRTHSIDDCLIRTKIAFTRSASFKNRTIAATSTKARWIFFFLTHNTIISRSLISAECTSSLAQEFVFFFKQNISYLPSSYPRRNHDFGVILSSLYYYFVLLCSSTVNFFFFFCLFGKKINRRSLMRYHISRRYY